MELHQLSRLVARIVMTTVRSPFAAHALLPNMTVLEKVLIFVVKPLDLELPLTVQVTAKYQPRAKANHRMLLKLRMNTRTATKLSSGRKNTKKLLRARIKAQATLSPNSSLPLMVHMTLRSKLATPPLPRLPNRADLPVASEESLVNISTRFQARAFPSLLKILISALAVEITTMLTTTNVVCTEEPSENNLI